MPMPIHRLTIRGFRSIRQLEDFEMRSLNVLIGANGSGKSNLIEFLEMLTSFVRESFQSFSRERGGARTLLHRGAQPSDQIFGRVNFASAGYDFTLKPTDDGGLYFDEQSTWRGPISNGLDFHRQLAKGRSESGLGKAAREAGAATHGDVARVVVDAIQSWVVYHFHDTSKQASIRLAHKVTDDDRMEERGRNLAPFLLSLRASQLSAYERIRDTVRLTAPFFDDFRLKPRDEGGESVVALEWLQRGSTEPFLNSQLSDGTLRFIALATTLLQPTLPATVIIDEPELGLHPQAIAVLAGLLKSAATRTQVLVCTQSPTLLDHFAPEDVVVAERREGASHFSRPNAKELESWLEDYSLGQLWQKNVLRAEPTRD